VCDAAVHPRRTETSNDSLSSLDNFTLLVVLVCRLIWPKCDQDLTAQCWRTSALNSTLYEPLANGLDVTIRICAASRSTS
jgi:hypothetical protein